jgi:hypothetical protein
MSSRLLLAFLVCSLGMSGLSAAQIAQFKPCSFEETSISSTTDGLSVWRVVVQEESAKSTATALIPTAKGPTAGILFTHSKLQGADKGVDLVSFAYGMARAGAASILLDGQMNLNDDNFRSAHLLACTGQWLLNHTKLDPRKNRLAVVGPYGDWGGGDTPNCLPGETPCWVGIAWLNIGQTTPNEQHNTKLMLTSEGQLRMAKALARWLELTGLEPQWFKAIQQ